MGLTACYGVWPASLKSTDVATIAFQIPIDYMYIGGNRPTLVHTLCYSDCVGYVFRLFHEIYPFSVAKKLQ